MSDTEEDFSRVFIWVLSLLVLFTIVVMLLARSVGLDENSGPMTDKDIDERTMPYGTIQIAGETEAMSAEAEAAPDKATPAKAATAPTKAETMPAKTEAAPTKTEAMPAKAETTTAIDGQALYAACAGCHATGAAGAPAVGNAAAWANRFAMGKDHLIASAINGKGAMPPKGGRSDLSDAQIKAIVEYMLSVSK